MKEQKTLIYHDPNHHHLTAKEVEEYLRRIIGEGYRIVSFVLMAEDTILVAVVEK